MMMFRGTVLSFRGEVVRICLESAALEKRLQASLMPVIARFLPSGDEIESVADVSMEVMT
jgi:hypothetical protein